MAYKDFTQFNEAAQDIRPTARIQLIQRILNAASLVSSLAQGVPIRWASSYKSFQVLKYVTDQDPVDVTTNAAISAVDSVLYEADNQLKSSTDDMNTLTAELESLDIIGRAEVSNILPDLSAFDYLLLGEIPSMDAMLLAKLSNSGTGVSNFTIISLQGYISIRSSVYTGDDAWVCHMVRQVNDTNNPALDCFAYYVKPNSDNKGIILQADFLPEVNSLRIRAQNFGGDTVYANSLSKTALQQLIDDNQPHNISMSASSGRLNITGAIMGGVDVRGHADASSILGLPDPTNVIEVLDSMIE